MGALPPELHCTHSSTPSAPLSLFFSFKDTSNFDHEKMKSRESAHSQNSNNKTNHDLPTVFMLWQYVGIGFETHLSKHNMRMLADPENEFVMFHHFRKWIDHALSPWPPVEPLTVRLVLLRL